MRSYLRAWVPGGTYFFTLNLAQRHGSRLLVDRIGDLREAFRDTRRNHPFTVEAIVVLLEHLHAIWTLPAGDADFSTRWSLIKARFSRAIVAGEAVSASRSRRRERGVWQRRFYEHTIRDPADLENHINYIHWNPVKHRWVRRVRDWPHSSFHRYVREGWLAPDWAASDAVHTMESE